MRQVYILSKFHFIDPILFCLAAYLDLSIILHFTTRFLKTSVIGILNYITVSEIKHFSWLYITVHVINIWTSHASCHLLHFFLRPGFAVTHNFCTVNLCLSLQCNWQNISIHNAGQLLWSMVFQFQHYINMNQGKLLRMSLSVRITAPIWFQNVQDSRTTGFWAWQGLLNGS